MQALIALRVWPGATQTHNHMEALIPDALRPDVEPIFDSPKSLSPDHLERPPRYRQEKQKHGRHARERKEQDKKGRKQKTDDERIAWKKAEQDGKNRKENEEHMQIARAKAEKNHKSQNDEKYKTPHKSVSELI